MPILTGRARLAGIVGWPVAHSRSPRIHGFWLDRHAIDGTYVPLPIHPDNFKTALRGLQAAGFAGVNVTIPHKLAAFDICDTVDDLSRQAGAVNTLVFHEGLIQGTNTDGLGFMAALREAGVNPGAGPALILGAGGAARAVVAALLACQIPVSLANRTRARAMTLASHFPELRIIGWEEREHVLAECALLVNATSLGMDGQPPLVLDLCHAPSSLVVAETIYTPLETGLLAAARARGLRAVDGLGMLLHQACPGFAAWFGVKPAVDAELRRFILADLGVG